MTRFLPIISAMALTGCATVLTPARCEAGLQAAETVQKIAAILEAAGYAPKLAAQVAQAVALGTVPFATACQVANPPAG